MGDTDLYDMALHATVDLRPGGEPVEWTAQRCGALVVTVLRPDGSPVQDAYLDIRSPRGEALLASLEWLEVGPTSNERGQIDLPDVMPGDYRIAAGWSGWLGRPMDVRIEPGETTALTLTLD